MTPMYYLVIYLVSALTTTQNCITPAHEKSTFGPYNTRPECEAAYTAAYGEGVTDTNYKIFHMCIKAPGVMP